MAAGRSSGELSMVRTSGWTIRDMKSEKSRISANWSMVSKACLETARGQSGASNNLKISNKGSVKLKKIKSK